MGFVDKQQEQYRATVAALSDGSLLTPAEAQQALPELSLKLSDRRGEGSTPIPAPPNLPPHVEWNTEAF